MMKSFLLFGFVCILCAQEIPAKKLSSLILKTAYFNKINNDKYYIVQKSETAYSKELAKLLNAKVLDYNGFSGIKEYANVVFVDLSDKEIKQAKKASSKILTFSNKVENISVVSVVFGLQRPSKKIQIIANLSESKDEADFRSVFLKIAQRRK